MGRGGGKGKKRRKDKRGDETKQQQGQVKKEKM